MTQIVEYNQYCLHEIDPECPWCRETLRDYLSKRFPDREDGEDLEELMEELRTKNINDIDGLNDMLFLAEPSVLETERQVIRKFKYTSDRPFFNVVGMVRVSLDSNAQMSHNERTYFNEGVV